jgi:hypothetical protein
MAYTEMVAVLAGLIWAGEHYTELVTLSLVSDCSVIYIVK